MTAVSPARLRPMEGDASISDSDDESPSLPSRLSRTRLDLLGQEAGPAEATESYQFQTLPLEAQHALRAVISDGADELDLFRSDVCDDHLELISSLLRAGKSASGGSGGGLLSKLSVANLGDNEIAARGAAAVAEAIAAAGAPALRGLLLGRNRIGDEGCAAVAAALGGGAAPELRELGLSVNAISCVGAAALAAAPPAKLQRLYLARNQISDAGAAALAAAVGRGALSELQELWLASNRVGDAGLGALARALFAPGRGARQLDLQANRIGDAGLADLADFVRGDGEAEGEGAPTATNGSIGLAENRECTAAGKEALAAVAAAAAWRVALRL